MARERVMPARADSYLPAVDKDLTYVTRVQDGDTEAFEPLWRKYERPLYQYFLRRTHHRQEAEDLASETLVAAFQSLPQFRGSGSNPEVRSEANSFQSYLHGIARHKYSHWARRKRVRKEIRASDVTPSEASEPDGNWVEAILETGDQIEEMPMEAILKLEERETICYALASIDSSVQFRVMMMHYFAGMTHQDIAALLTTRSETVNSRLQDGRKAFRRHYQQYDIGHCD
jgi:RNA polymerase sigma-70 factor (ECF subfamily)